MRLVKGLLDRCLEALELLAGQPEWLRLSDIAARLDLQKGPAHRLLTNLVEQGWVEQDAATERYRLTLKLSLLGQQYLHGTGLPGLVQPVIDGVAQQCKELVRVTVVDGESLRWFASSQGADPGLMYQPSMSGPIALHATANGKAWLASQTDEQALQIVVRSGFPKTGVVPLAGPRAVNKVAALLAELEATRKRGYGLSVEEAEPGVTALAVIVRNAIGQVVGTMSIAGPRMRLEPDRYRACHALLTQAVGRLKMVWPRGERPAGAADADLQAVAPALAQ